MLAGLLTAIAAAVCYGVGSVLQAVAARGSESVAGLDPRLFVRLLKSWRYLLGVGLDSAGFLLGLVAVRSLPLFVVQSIVASFLAIAAILGAIFLKMSLNRQDRIGLGVVIFGLVLVGASAAEDGSVSVHDSTAWWVLASSVLLVVLAVPLAKLPGARGAAVMGAIAGLAFGVTAIASRILPGDLSLDHLGSEIGTLLGSPSLYALAISGIVALMTYSIALQRGSVTQATAPLVVGETVVPALVGLWVLGDRPREGWGWVAVVGFVLSVIGALALARHGELPTDEGADGGPVVDDAAVPERSA